MAEATVATTEATVATTEATVAPAEGSPPSLDCIICFCPYDRLFRLPKALGCGHTFCLQCLAKVASVATGATPGLPCPVCRRPTALPPGRGPPALPTPADLLPLLPPGPAASVRFSRPRGLLYLAQVPTVTLSLESGPPSDPPAAPPARPWPRWPLARAVALTVALTVGGGLAFGGVFLFFLQPGACAEGGPGANSTWGGPGWPPY